MKAKENCELEDTCENKNVMCCECSRSYFVRDHYLELEKEGAEEKQKDD